MFLKKQICPKCKVGKKSYELDSHSESCPYIGHLKDGKCKFFQPLDKPEKEGLFNGLKNKQKG